MVCQSLCLSKVAHGATSKHSFNTSLEPSGQLLSIGPVDAVVLPRIEVVLRAFSSRPNYGDIQAYCEARFEIDVATLARQVRYNKRRTPDLCNDLVIDFVGVLLAASGDGQGGIVAVAS